MANAKTFDYGEKMMAKKRSFAQKTFRKELQRKCGFTVGHFAQLHTQKDWNAIMDKGDFRAEIGIVCPKGEVILKSEWVEPLFLFAEYYAKDSGNKPRC